MTSTNNSASEQTARIHAENDMLQEQINMWKLIPLEGHQASQMQKMLISVGTALNRRSFIDSNIRILQKNIENNQAKIEKRVASEKYRKNLRSGASQVAPVQPTIPVPDVPVIFASPEPVQKSNCTCPIPHPPADDGCRPGFHQDADAMQAAIQQQMIQNAALMAAYPGMSLHAIAVQRFAESMDDYANMDRD